MRPGILYDLSQRLAVLLEDGLRGHRAEPRIPVLICHPLDPIENKDFQGGTVGVLYPLRVSPESRLRAASLALEGFALERGPAGEDLKERVRLPGLWLRVRYVFLLAGGTVQNQLGAIAAALRTLHDHPLITLGPAGAEGGGERTEDPARSSQGAGAAGEGDRRGPADETSREEGPQEVAQGSFPLRILEDCEGWRDLGLSEHRLTVSFEVTIPLASERTEPVERIFERELELEEGSK